MMRSWLGAVDQHLEPDRLIEAIRPYACAFDEELLGDNLRFDQHVNSGRHYDATLVATTQDLDLRARILRTYDNGLIDPRSEAAHFASLVRIAAHYGHPKAAADLAYMYHHGFHGAPPDNTKAAKWASVAVKHDLAAGTTHAVDKEVDKLRFLSPEDDDDASITDGWEESETIPGDGFSVTITPMRPIEHYLGPRNQIPPAASAEVTPRRTDEAHSPVSNQHPHHPQASPGLSDEFDAVKLVLIVIAISGLAVLLLAV